MAMAAELTTAQHGLSAVVSVSGIQLLFSYLISHPLYLSYLLFFSPSLLKLLSFLSPLFLTTSLLLASILLTLSHHPSLLYHHDFHYSASEALYVYNIVFDVGDQLLLVPQAEQEEEALKKKKKKQGITASIAAEPPPPPSEEGSSIMTLATLLHQKQEQEDVLLPGKEVKAAAKVKFEVGQREREEALSGGSKATSEAEKLGSYGSMRKEKEWRRTLACKLFEERHNADSSEGMDLLWETYETDNQSVNGGKAAAVKAAGKQSKLKKKGSSSKIGHHDDDSYDGYEEEEEVGGDDGGGRLCCLQALKFSAGKMNRLGGMGKISKAIKGFGWLHTKTKRVPVPSN